LAERGTESDPRRLPDPGLPPVPYVIRDHHQSADDILREHGITGLRSTAPGRYYTICPRCSDGRKGAHKRNKVLGVTIDAVGVKFGCNHCQWTGEAILTDRRLSQKHEEYLDGRGIDPEQAAAMALYSARPAPRGDGEEGFKEPIPSPTGDILVWPYIENGQEVNAKFRAPGKRFYQRPNGKKTFCNSDAIDDPEVTSGRQPLVITEGEIDMATAIGDGHPWTVSVPDGAPADKDQFGRKSR
jgi:hypothetical protein